MAIVDCVFGVSVVGERVQGVVLNYVLLGVKAEDTRFNPTRFFVTAVIE
jgi:hypothetical protein